MTYYASLTVVPALIMLLLDNSLYTQNSEDTRALKLKWQLQLRSRCAVSSLEQICAEERYERCLGERRLLSYEKGFNSSASLPK